jgi:hypothetical protein
MEFVYLFFGVFIAALVLKIAINNPLIIVISAAIGAYVAYQEQLDAGFYFMVGVVFVASLIARFASDAKKPVEPESELKKCRFCAEPIKQEAVVCRFCNRDIGP